MHYFPLDNSTFGFPDFDALTSFQYAITDSVHISNKREAHSALLRGKKKACLQYRKEQHVLL